MMTFWENMSMHLGRMQREATADKNEDEFRPANIDSGPRCGECRLGLGVHNPDDPLCETRPIPPAKGEAL